MLAIRSARQVNALCFFSLLLAWGCNIPDTRGKKAPMPPPSLRPEGLPEGGPGSDSDHKAGIIVKDGKISKKIEIPFEKENGSIYETSAKQGDVLLIECSGIDFSLRPEIQKIQLTPSSDEVPLAILKGLQSFNTSLPQGLSTRLTGSVLNLDSASRDSGAEYKAMQKRFVDDLGVAKEAVRKALDKVKADEKLERKFISIPSDLNTDIEFVADDPLLLLARRCGLDSESLVASCLDINSRLKKLESGFKDLAQDATTATQSTSESPSPSGGGGTSGAKPLTIGERKALWEKPLASFDSESRADGIARFISALGDSPIFMGDEILLPRLKILLGDLVGIYDRVKAIKKQHDGFKADLNSAIQRAEGQLNGLEGFLETPDLSTAAKAQVYGSTGIIKLNEMKGYASEIFDRYGSLGGTFEKLSKVSLQKGRLSAVDQMGSGNVFYWIRYSSSESSVVTQKPAINGTDQLPTREPLNHAVLIRLASGWRGIASAGFGFGSLTNDKVQIQTGGNRAESQQRDPVAVEVATLYTMYPIRDGIQKSWGPCLGIGVNQEGQARFYGGISWQLGQQMMFHVGLEYGPAKYLKSGLDLNNLPPNITEDQITSTRSNTRPFISLSWRLGS